MRIDDLEYSDLTDKELVEQLAKRMAEMKKLLIEVRDMLKEASNVE